MNFIETNIDKTDNFLHYYYCTCNYVLKENSVETICGIAKEYYLEYYLFKFNPNEIIKYIGTKTSEEILDNNSWRVCKDKMLYGNMNILEILIGHINFIFHKHNKQIKEILE